jgi:hypothetical protein
MTVFKRTSALWSRLVVMGALVILGVVFLNRPRFVREGRASPANACINNLRQIDGAKEQWSLEHNARTNDLVTLQDIKPYLGANNAFIRPNKRGDVTGCPLGGLYTIGSVGIAPTCSIGTNDSRAHILPP